ncbi:MAG: nucleoside triphosphate pyrophosphohydrolase family protein [Cryomorphaceae bacterium]|jgi:NTP pyrophosphatase (non-canonical NTP hydrolase)|nr:nucleoside triphosphate pyrophosphohydrolase family protein [Cryomorphaceae bacterium]
MTFDEYKQLAMRTKKDGDFNFDIKHSVYGLSGEVGEFADCIKRWQIYGKELDRENAREEIGDILWFVALAANALGCSLDELAQENINKLARRYPEKYTDELANARIDKY